MLYHKIYPHHENDQWVVFIHGAGGSSVVWYKQIQSYARHFNLLLIDLHGHGQSANVTDHSSNRFTFENIALDVVKVLDHCKIKKAHFVGVSMGTIIVRKLAEIRREYVSSMILVGAITRLNMKSRFLVKLGRIFHKVVPYMWLYKVFAFIIMPMDQHEESRNVFIREARKLARHEFIRWFKLTRRLTAKLSRMEAEDPGLPTLYVMGEQDYILLEPVKELVKKYKNRSLAVIEKCGHVVNIEKAEIFNELSINYIRQWISESPPQPGLGEG
ncbi:MAG: alpha/beta fold hydrolase [Bacteroidota bacterium]